MQIIFGQSQARQVMRCGVISSSQAQHPAVATAMLFLLALFFLLRLRVVPFSMRDTRTQLLQTGFGEDHLGETVVGVVARSLFALVVEHSLLGCV